MFNPHSIKKLILMRELAHLSIKKIGTSNAMFFGMFHGSFRRRVWSSKAGKVARHALAFATYPVLSGANLINGGIGAALLLLLQVESLE